MLRLKGAREFEDEQNKLRMKLDAPETKVKVERDTLDKETHILAEGLSSQTVNEGAQIGKIMEGKRLVKTEQDILKPQRIQFFTSDRSLVADISCGRAENVDSLDSVSIYQSLSLTQDSTLSKFINLKSADDPMRLRKAALRNMAITGFPLRCSSNLDPANERLSSTSLSPPNIPFYSKLKPNSPARRMRDLMEETRRTLQYNPYTLVDLGKEPNLGFPILYVNAVY